jgi:hypothetical protein
MQRVCVTHQHIYPLHCSTMLTKEPTGQCLNVSEKGIYARDASALCAPVSRTKERPGGVRGPCCSHALRVGRMDESGEVCSAGEKSGAHVWGCHAQHKHLLWGRSVCVCVCVRVCVCVCVRVRAHTHTHTNVGTIAVIRTCRHVYLVTIRLLSPLYERRSLAWAGHGSVKVLCGPHLRKSVHE